MKVLVFAFCSNLRYNNRAHMSAAIWRTVHEHIVNEELFNASSSWTARKSCGNMYRDEQKVSSVNSEPSQSSWRCVSSFASFESFAFHFIFGWASADFQRGREFLKGVHCLSFVFIVLCILVVFWYMFFWLCASN